MFISRKFSKLLYRVALSLKTEIDNPTSNFLWNKTHFISIERCQGQHFLVLYAAVKSIRSTKTAMILTRLEKSMYSCDFDIHSIIRKIGTASHRIPSSNMSSLFCLQENQCLRKSGPLNGEWSVLFPKNRRFKTSTNTSFYTFGTTDIQQGTLELQMIVYEDFKR